MMSELELNIERMMEMGDIKRKELKEEGANCDNCRKLDNQQEHGHHCYMFKDEPQGVCAKWIASNTLAFGFPSNWAGRKG